MLQLSGRNIMRLRIAVSMAIGVGSGVYCWFLQMHFHLGAGDFNWAVWKAQDLLAHRDPYARPMQLYPLTCAVFWPALRMDAPRSCRGHILRDQFGTQGAEAVVGANAGPCFA